MSSRCSWSTSGTPTENSSFHSISATALSQEQEATRLRAEVDRRFPEIWQDTSDPIMRGLKEKPRKIKGRCGNCRYFSICGGNTRVRALQLTGAPWAEDPACYLTEDEIRGMTNISSSGMRPAGFAVG